MITIPEIDIDGLIRRYNPMILSLCLRMIENRELAEEASQEAWIEVQKSLQRFKGKSQISTWIYRIAIRTIMRYAKNEKRYSARMITDYLINEEREYPGESSLDEKTWVRGMCDKCITGSLHCLSNRDRLLFLLHEVAGLGSREISGILPMTEAAIRQNMSRGRRKLQSFLDDQCVLYNPQGKCRCRMVQNVRKSGIHEEFEKIRRDIHEISFLRQCGTVLSGITPFLADLCHEYGEPPTNGVNIKGEVHSGKGPHRICVSKRLHRNSGRNDRKNPA